MNRLEQVFVSLVNARRTLSPFSLSMSPGGVAWSLWRSAWGGLGPKVGHTVFLFAGNPSFADAPDLSAGHAPYAAAVDALPRPSAMGVRAAAKRRQPTHKLAPPLARAPRSAILSANPRLTLDDGLPLC
jgi:hypothetical protein